MRLGDPSTTRMLADRLVESVGRQYGDASVEVVSLRELAHDITDATLTSFNHMQYNNVSGASTGNPRAGSWQIAVPNGSYDVAVTVGEPTPAPTPRRTASTSRAPRPSASRSPAHRPAQPASSPARPASPCPTAS